MRFCEGANGSKTAIDYNDFLRLLKKVTTVSVEDGGPGGGAAAAGPARNGSRLKTV